MALVVGNEVRGVSPAILRCANDIVAIPMHGAKESLNVAVAAGVALYALNLKRET
jgi:TrmH family RNA methyltransferase